MNKSLRLFTVKGIDIRVHLTFPFILVWAALQFGQIYGGIRGAVFGLVAITLLFILVTLHELGHSFAARRYGIPVKQIVLSPIGGVAQLQRMPDKPAQELVIAIAGPAVNVAMAVLLGALALFSGVGPANLINGITGADGATLAALLSYVFVSNLFLAIFNLIPAFPMDGGRIFRALLAMRMNYASATKIAANVGRGFAVLMGLYGLFNGGIFMIFIAFFIFTAAGREADYARVKDSLGGYTVQQTYSPTAYRLSPSSTLQQAQNMSVYTGQREFAIVEGDQLVGYLNAQQLRTALASHPNYVPVSTIMSQDVSPVTPTTDLFETQQRMVQAQTEALPVVNLANQYLGLVTRQHISDFFQMVQTTPPIIQGQRSA
jgi:Zn-dependent protease